MSRSSCPPWCIADHATEDEFGVVRHRGATRVVPVVLESRGTGGPAAAELLLEVSRLGDEAGVWLYLGDGWTGFSLPLESAARLAAALRDTLGDAGTVVPTGL